MAPRVLLSLVDSFWTQEQIELLQAFYKAILSVWQWFPECSDVAVVLLLLLQQLVLLGFAAFILAGSWWALGLEREENVMLSADRGAGDSTAALSWGSSSPGLTGFSPRSSPGLALPRDRSCLKPRLSTVLLAPALVPPWSQALLLLLSHHRGATLHSFPRS